MLLTGVRSGAGEGLPGEDAWVPMSEVDARTSGTIDGLHWLRGVGGSGCDIGVSGLGA